MSHKLFAAPVILGLLAMLAVAFLLTLRPHPAAGQDNNHPIQVVAVTDTTIAVAWPKIPDASGYGIAWWTADYDTFGSQYVTQESYTIKGLRPGTAYFVKVDGLGAEALKVTTTSGKATATPTPVPPTPTPTPTPTPPPPSAPVVSITGGASITEGGDATFTITANPAPAADLTVSVNVTQQGDYGATSGSRNVTIPATGSATLTVSTTDDGVDEADGSVTATLAGGTGYTISSSGSAIVAVADDDVPTLSIAAGGGISEGGSASFTVTSSPAPYQVLSVAVTVTDSGDFATGGQTGSRTIAVPATGSVSFNVRTDDDSADEADGTITATLAAGSGYTLSAATASVAVADDDAAQQATQSSVTELEAKIQNRIDLTEQNNDVHSNRIWRRALAAVRGESPPDGLPELTAAIAQRLADNHRSGGRTELADLWQDIADALNGTPPPPPTPEVSIAAGAGVTEGGSVTFTITSDPAPAASLDVTVDVTQSGDFAATGQQTITIPAAGSATLTVATTDDSVDEADGSITATLVGGTGYLVGSSGSATVAVSDDDVPALSIAAGGGISEGGSASFTVSASPAPYQALTVAVTVADSGDFATGGQTGSRTITVPATGSVSFSVGTDDDSTDEADGSITATLAGGGGYAVGSSGSATVAVSDDDGAPQSGFVLDAALVAAVTGKADNHPNAGAAERLRKVVKGMTGEAGGYTAAECRETAKNHGVLNAWKPWCDEIERRENFVSSTNTVTQQESQVSVYSASASEGSPVNFQVSVNPPSQNALVVGYETTDGTAHQHEYGSTDSGTLTIPPGSSGESIQIQTVQDQHAESDETFGIEISLQNPSSQTRLGQSSGVGTIQNDDSAATHILNVNSPSVAEGDLAGEEGALTFTVTIDQALSEEVTLDCHVIHVSASINDFAAPGSCQVTIPANATTSNSLTINTTTDTRDENDETVIVVFTAASAPSGVVFNAPPEATATILDDDTLTNSTPIGGVEVLAPDGFTTLPVEGLRAVAELSHSVIITWDLMSEATHYEAIWWPKSDASDYTIEPRREYNSASLNFGGPTEDYAYTVRALIPSLAPGTTTVLPTPSPDPGTSNSTMTLGEVFVESLHDAMARSEEAANAQQGLQEGQSSERSQRSSGGTQQGQGQKQQFPIQQQQPPPATTSVVYVVDDSGSMDGDWPEVRTALGEVRDEVGITNTKVALIAFGGVATTLFGLTDHASAPWDSHIQSFGGFKGSTDYVVSLTAAKDLLTADTATTKKIVFMSDAQMEYPSAVVAELIAANIIVDTVFFGEHFSSNKGELQRISTDTGGSHSDVAKPSTGTTNDPAVTSRALSVILLEKVAADTTTLYLFDNSHSLHQDVLTLPQESLVQTKMHTAMIEVETKVQGIATARAGAARFIGSHELSTTETVTIEINGVKTEITLADYYSPYEIRTPFNTGSAFDLNYNLKGATGSTDLDNALDQAFTDISAESGTTKRVVLVTDGITHSKPTTATLAKYTGGSVCLDVVAMGGHADRVYLKALADTSGLCGDFDVAGE